MRLGIRLDIGAREAGAVVPPPAPVASTFTASSANLSISSIGDGVYQVEKVAGAISYNDKFYSNTAYTGDFMFAMRRMNLNSGEMFQGVTDDPAYTYQTHDRGFYTNGSSYSTYDLGFGNISGAVAATTEWLVFKRVAGVLSHYMTTDLTALGTSVKTISDGATFNGTAILDRVGLVVQVKMIAV